MSTRKGCGWDLVRLTLVLLVSLALLLLAVGVGRGAVIVSPNGGGSSGGGISSVTFSNLTTGLSNAMVFTNAMAVGKTVYLDALNGNDTTGQRGRFDKPFRTSVGVTNALAGDLVYGRVGNYTNVPLKNGVRFYWDPGATNWGEAGSSIPLLHDRGGAITSSVFGAGTFIHPGTGPVWETTNGNSQVIIHGDYLWQSYDVEAVTAAVMIGGGWTEGYFRRIRCERYDCWWVDGGVILPTANIRRAWMTADHWEPYDTAAEALPAGAATNWGDVVARGNVINPIPSTDEQHVLLSAGSRVILDFNVAYAGEHTIVLGGGGQTASSPPGKARIGTIVATNNHINPLIWVGGGIGHSMDFEGSIISSNATVAPIYAPGALTLRNVSVQTAFPHSITSTAPVNVNVVGSFTANKPPNANVTLSGGWVNIGTNSYFGGAAHSKVRTLSFTGGTNVIVDCYAANAFNLTLTTNAKLWFTNFLPGGEYSVNLRQDSTGTRLVYVDTTNLEVKGTVAATTNANALDLVELRVDDRGTNGIIVMNYGVGSGGSGGGTGIATNGGSGTNNVFSGPTNLGTVNFNGSSESLALVVNTNQLVVSNRFVGIGKIPASGVELDVAGDISLGLFGVLTVGPGNTISDGDGILVIDAPVTGVTGGPLSVTAGLALNDGLVGAPAIYFTSDADSGLFWDGSNIVITRNGTRVVQTSGGNWWLRSDAGIYYLGASADVGLGRAAAGRLKVFDAGTGRGSLDVSNLNAVSVVVTNRSLSYTLTNQVWIDWSAGNAWSLTLTNSDTLLRVTNVSPTTWKNVVVNLRQDGTGSRLLRHDTMNMKTNSSGLVLSTAANALDVLTLMADDRGTNVSCLLNVNFQ